MIQRIILSFFMLWFLAGCGATRSAQTASDYRAWSLANDTGYMQETITVESPYATVAERLQSTFERCLSGTNIWSEQGSSHSAGGTTTYNPTVEEYEDSSSYYYQIHQTWGAKVSKQPEKGYFVFLADVVPKGGESTGITISRGYLLGVQPKKKLRNLFLEWARGDTDNCPDDISSL